MCVDGELEGTCELSSYCSFPDPSCPAQRRYGELAAPGLAGTCVELQNAIVNSTCDVDASQWFAFQSSISVSPVARTGAQSCLVCGTGQTDFTMDDEGASIEAALAGQMFMGEAWVRTAPGAAVAMFGYVQVRDAVTYDNATSMLASLSDTWQPVSVTYTATTTHPVELFVAGKTDAPGTNPCILVDDIALYRVR